MTNLVTQDEAQLLMAMLKVLTRFENGPERLKLALETAVDVHGEMEAEKRRNLGKLRLVHPIDPEAGDKTPLLH